MKAKMDLERKKLAPIETSPTLLGLLYNNSHSQGQSTGAVRLA
jgi:hypothetical protein